MTKNSDNRVKNQETPILRVFYGDLADGHANEGRPDHDHSSNRTDREIELFWAGRIPAARISTRVAA
jgi:hypothetical protein